MFWHLDIDSKIITICYTTDTGDILTENILAKEYNKDG